MSVSTGALDAASRGDASAPSNVPATSAGLRRRAPVAAGDSRPWLVVAATMVMLHLVLAWLRRAPSLTTMNDDAYYILLARALRAFEYRELFIVGSPIHAQYPPAYPAVLALISALFGERYDLFLAL